MNPIIQTIIVTVIASAISPAIVLLFSRYLDKRKIYGDVRNDDLESIERYQNIAERAIAQAEATDKRNRELEQRVADLEAATVGPFEILLTVVTRPTPTIQSQSIRLLELDEEK